ncbi:MAG: ArsR/SmtB family transcription factor, partial [Candidatus Kariarchaeaceae archaeon]
MTDDLNKFEQHNICCPGDSGSKYIWEAQLDYEQSETIPYRVQIETLLNNLKNPTRLSILFYLNGRVNCVCELVKKLKMANSAVSYHLSYLIDNSFVSAKTQG